MCVWTLFGSEVKQSIKIPLWENWGEMNIDQIFDEITIKLLARGYICLITPYLLWIWADMLMDKKHIFWIFFKAIGNKRN